MLIAEQDVKIAIIGLGYVGLPLAVAFGNRFPTVGFDINEHRLQALHKHMDLNSEVSSAELVNVHSLTFTGNITEIAKCNVFIVTVPTPIDAHRNPDLSPLVNASNMLGKIIQPGCVVIYESTVYPGAVEEVCVPLLTKGSGLVFNRDFYVGYSPERINPGDKTRTVADILKITSGSTPEAGDFVDYLYKQVITAGTHRVSSIKVAEAAKVIENTQRDLNIALINELAIIFNKLNLNTEEILDAAATKWNFMRFSPGLVGGHCIGVDPYYLTYKAEEIGYHPEVILAGRRINDNMGKYVANEVIKAMLKCKIHVDGAQILIMGFTFKENCPDFRNTKVIDVINELQNYGANVCVYDPLVDAEHVQNEYKINLLSQLESGKFDAIVLAVAHAEFKNMSIQDIRGLGKAVHVVYDVKHLLPSAETDGRL